MTCLAARRSLPPFRSANGRTPNYLTVANEIPARRIQMGKRLGVSGGQVRRPPGQQARTGIWNARYGLMRRRSTSFAICIRLSRSNCHQPRRAGCRRRGVRSGELTTNYILLQVWDLFSFYICSNESLEEESYDPVPTGYAEGAVVVMRLKPISGKTHQSSIPTRSISPRSTSTSSIGAADRHVPGRAGIPGELFRNAAASRDVYFYRPDHGFTLRSQSRTHVGGRSIRSRSNVQSQTR